MRWKQTLLAGASVALAASAFSAKAATPEEFYRNKQMIMIMSADAGGQPPVARGAGDFTDPRSAAIGELALWMRITGWIELLLGVLWGSLWLLIRLQVVPLQFGAPGVPERSAWLVQSLALSGFGALTLRAAASFRRAAGGAETISPAIERLKDLYEQTLTEVARLPGVRSASLSRWGLLSGNGTSDGLSVPGRPTAIHVDVHLVLPGYFKTMGIPVQVGRDVSWSDREHAPPVIIVNQLLARQIGGASAIGRTGSFLPLNDAKTTEGWVSSPGNAKRGTRLEVFLEARTGTTRGADIS